MIGLCRVIPSMSITDEGQRRECSSQANKYLPVRSTRGQALGTRAHAQEGAGRYFNVLRNSRKPHWVQQYGQSEPGVPQRGFERPYI